MNQKQANRLLWQLFGEALLQGCMLAGLFFCLLAIVLFLFLIHL